MGNGFRELQNVTCVRCCSTIALLYPEKCLKLLTYLGLPLSSTALMRTKCVTCRLCVLCAYIGSFMPSVPQRSTVPCISACRGRRRLSREESVQPSVHVAVGAVASGRHPPQAFKWLARFGAIMRHFAFSEGRVLSQLYGFTASLTHQLHDCG